MLRPWLPLDMYLAWRIKAALLCVLSLSPNHCHNPPSPLICFMLSGCDQLMSFFGPAINHANEPRPAKDKKLCFQSKTRSLELNFSPSSLILILFFKLVSLSLLLSASLFPSELLIFPLSMLFFPQSSFPFCFVTPFPTSHSCNISPSPAASCWAELHESS